jgi:predicted AAA+ superfamily ATPase
LQNDKVEYQNRHITNRLEKALETTPIVFLNGARQTGKSTLVQQLAPRIGKFGHPAQYVTFDRPTYVAAASAAPEAFLTSYDPPLIIDEVQMVPELFRTLKVIVDELRGSGNANGKYLLTGSANILALPNLSGPLVGRMSILTLYPFTVAEATHDLGGGIERMLKMDFKQLNDRGIPLTQAIKAASFPELLQFDIEKRRTWFDGYITTILQRDVRQLAELEKINVLPLMLKVLATRVGGLINDSDISREVGLNSVTSKSYRSILKMMFLAFDVKPWYRNIGKRLVKSPKGYLLDTLMACHLLDQDLDDIAKGKPDLFGHLLENFVATELQKQLSNGDTKAELFHFRTSDQKEVDFIIERPDGSVLAIEVKRSESVTIADFKGIMEFASITNDDFIGGIVLYSGKDAVPFGKNLWAVPFHVLW